MTNAEYIEMMQEGEDVCNGLRTAAQSDPEIPPTKDQELVRRLRDFWDKIKDHFDFE